MVLLVVIVVLLGLFYVWLILFYLKGWRNLQEFEVVSNKTSTTISVVVAARNEADNIENLLEDLANQSFLQSRFEVIIVDDHSDDDTFQIASNFTLSNLKVLKLESGIGKKAALHSGISDATNELIVTTDADCRVGEKWLETLAAFYEKKRAKVIASPVVFNDGNGLLHQFQMLDFLSLMGITAACIQNNFPNMVNGANLAYERQAYFEVQGFEGVDHIPTGDDIFLTLKLHHLYPGSVHFLKANDAIISTKTQPSWASFFSQRIRWISKSRHFQDKKITTVLVMAWFFNAAIFGSIFFGITFSKEWLFMGLTLLTIKLGLDGLFVFPVARYFNRQKVLWLFLPIELLHVLYVIIIGLVANFLPYNWKGRSY